jgi:hypothetical protein
MFYCGNSNNSHKHRTVAEMRQCLAPKSQRVLPTEAQLNYVRDLHGNVERARGMTKSEVSRYIDDLRAANRRRQQMTPAPTPVIRVPLDMLSSVPDGYYAWTPDDRPLTFLRIKTHKSRHSRWNGCRTVQTQHGPNWSEPRFVIRRDGSVWMPNRNDAVIQDVLIGLICSYKQCAKTYARELGRCMRCNLELTDERSRHYGIGPDCEKIWTWVVPEKDEELGYAHR